MKIKNNAKNLPKSKNYKMNKNSIKVKSLLMIQKFNLFLNKIKHLSNKMISNSKKKVQKSLAVYMFIQKTKKLKNKTIKNVQYQIMKHPKVFHKINESKNKT